MDEAVRRVSTQAARHWDLYALCPSLEIYAAPITETPNLPGGAHKSLRRMGKEPRGAQGEGGEVQRE